MSMNKKITIPMETTAYYQSVSKLGIRFWSQDIGTSTLQFKITRNNYALPLSNENVQVVLALTSGESFITTDDVTIENELEGIVSYTIPEEFMAVATEVVGQVYVATLDGDEIVVQRKFTFTVENDLLSTIPSEEKLRYIKMFSDLQEEMSTRLGGVETALTQLEQNVADVNNAREDGITAINNLYDAKLITFNQNYDDKMALIDTATTDLETYVDTSLADMTQKKADFDASVSGSGLVTTGQSANWQKYKLTDESGVLPIVNLSGDLEALQALPSGFYYRSFVPITGVGQTSSTGFVTVWESNGGQVKHISFKPYNSNQEFRMRFYNEWSGWELVTPDYTKIETPTGAQSKANTAENNAKTYTDTKFNSRHKTLFSGTANGVGTTLSLSETLDNFIFLYIYGNFDGGNFAETGDPSGTSDIVIDRTNVIGTDGAYATVFEILIQKTSRTQLKIISDTYHGINSGNGSGPNANRFTITKIIGVRA